MFEKRQFPRCTVDEPVHLSQSGSQANPARVMDLSVQGLRVHVEEELDPGATVFLEMDFLTPSFLEEAPTIEAVVHHTSPAPDGQGWQVGLEMKIDDPVQQKTLESRLSRCESKV